MDDQVEKLEIKVSYLESQMEELNEVVINQMKELAAFSAQILKLEQKVSELIEEAGDGDRPSRRPPHY